MSATERIVNDLNVAKLILCNPQMLTPEMCFRIGQAVTSAIDLLTEQEAMKPIYNEQKYGDHLPHCGNCEKVLPNDVVYGKVNFCHYCGRAVKWE